MIIALIANKNNPKVTIVIGKVKNTKIGFKIAFKIPRIIATIIDDVIFSTETPSIYLEIISTRIVVIISLNISFMIFF